MLTLNKIDSNCFLQSKEPQSLKVLSPSPTPPPLTIITEERKANNQDYRFETIRLQTFEDWPVNFIDPKDLAAAGFYYLHTEDKVKCFECKIEVYNWEEGDVPMRDHKRHSPICRFVRNIPCGNVPIGVDPNSIPVPSPRGYDVCGIHEIGSQPPNAYSENLSNLLFPTDARLKSLGVQRLKQPIYPKYANLELRVLSFDIWPKPMIDIKQLAEAGFFYTGEQDQTLCFHCGVGLKDWEPNDDPWYEHFKWFVKCHFLLMFKGKEYADVEGQFIKLSKETKPASLEEIFDDINLESNCGSNTVKNNIEENSNLASSAVAKKHELSKPMDDARLCKICYNAELQVVFLPCKHMCACVNCATLITKCAVCRKPIELVVRAILT
ncbi:PREDICTED: death-associated inhibitor of apoptosis 2-like isoform X1 [Polistes canadensis]|uniref:death-associated inhibitor of apoptosis 2-like isoform X1 n=1 Tax=Polistes canadensis TaxID=91411 RepID=UPI000718EF65|nr:PREDICTED: death-associated inhibitor of apoptosis 2-like isoform X1 [Polistes canadensis]XP_014600571.1 PREDICTED: death-associated inhibitor of apoptosis 2-like isoform X1 [Polistes canadensis]XP_014600573.1 PREDICTED: death-associated inhibitor of apoptosis 2-like isoform X1 [Polistes canadensis]XP_014600574.1 PREDICTED: death-associated inhibitor of apoptosis 2-like isoform X1 [Polistes canadensis]